MSDIQVVIIEGMREAFEQWLASRGQYLFKIPLSDSEDDIPTYGIGIKRLGFLREAPWIPTQAEVEAYRRDVDDIHPS